MSPLTYIVGQLRAVDPKLVAVVVTFLLTQAVLKLGFDLDAALIPGYLSWSAAIALAAGGAAGWWKDNAATILRTPQESGNPPADVVAGVGLETGPEPFRIEAGTITAARLEDPPTE